MPTGDKKRSLSTLSGYCHMTQVAIKQPNKYLTRWTLVSMFNAVTTSITYPVIHFIFILGGIVGVSIVCQTASHIIKCVNFNGVNNLQKVWESTNGKRERVGGNAMEGRDGLSLMRNTRMSLCVSKSCGYKHGALIGPVQT